MLLLTLLALVTVASTCPCLDAYPAGITPGRVDIDGATYDYPTSYGLSECAPHDAGLPPLCAGTSPAFCTTPWCYVDAHCDAPTQPSFYFGRALNYSYAACGGNANATSAFFDSVECFVECRPVENATLPHVAFVVHGRSDDGFWAVVRNDAATAAHHFGVGLRWTYGEEDSPTMIAAIEAHAALRPQEPLIVTIPDANVSAAIAAAVTSGVRVFGVK